MTMKSYAGPCVELRSVANGILEIIIDLKGESSNRFSAATLEDLGRALDAVPQDGSVRGLMLRSGKPDFLMGADVTEFIPFFKKSESEIETWVKKTHALFNRIEDLPFPTVTLINGFALGGGCEVSLTTAFRIAAVGAKIGLPETKLGIFPGWGGCVRLSRLIGPDNAIEWIASAKAYSPEEALKYRMIDAIVAADQLVASGIKLLEDAATGKLEWKSRQEIKKSPLIMSTIEATMTFEGSKSFVGAQAGPNYPAPLAAIEAIEKGAKSKREAALDFEAKGFARIAKTPQVTSLVGVFLADQTVKRASKKWLAQARPIKSASVIGAGIMGGGIAYQSASSKIPVIMKDIKTEALDLGMKEASKLLEKRVERGQLKASDFGTTLTRIRPTLALSEIKETTIVVEAVVENEKIKSQVLAEIEANVLPDTIITSNTSTISITKLANALKRPENFCGMHFFNPVHRMPLVEVIRGQKSSDVAIATAVAYASAMGKTPIVVGDCPGFLVNRVLFPYWGGFMNLVRDGVPFEKIDKVMEKWGWPMGPAYLLDVVGIDTGHHALEVMSQGFPDRMKYDYRTALDVQYEAKRYGQKNGKGFYDYTQDAKGKPVKAIGPEVHALLKPVITGASNVSGEVSDTEIIERMMLPMIFECVRCLEDKIVGTPAEVDLSMLYGLGFPAFRGGPLRYADSLGAEKLLELSRKYAKFGKLYEAPATIQQKKGFFE